MTLSTPLLRRLLAGVALVVLVALGLANVAGADEPAPAYPPSPGGDEVVEAGAGTSTTEPTGEADAPAGEAAEDVDAEGDEPTDGPEESAAAATGSGAPDEGDRGAGRVLVLVGTALLLGGGVVAVARRI